MATYRQPPFRKGARILMTRPPPVKPPGRKFHLSTQEERGPAARPPVPAARPLGSGDLLVGLERRRPLLGGGGELAVALGGDLPPAGHDAPRPGRDEAADDDVLLQAREHVDPAGDRRLGEDAGGLLE